MMPLLSTALSFAGNLGGALLNKKAHKESIQSQEAQAVKNENLQKEFAQQGIRWKVEDAKRAGINPLMALGAPTHSFQASNIGAPPDTSMGDALSRMGQDASRAIQATRTQQERELATLQLQSARADITGKELDNQIRASKLQNMSATGPAFPGADLFMPGQGNSPLVNVKPVERPASQTGDPHQEAGWRQYTSFARTKDGMTPVIPESLSESMEDDFLGKLIWRAQHNIGPLFNDRTKPSRSQLPKGYNDWSWKPHKNQWEPVRKKQKTPWQRWSKFISGWQK